MPEKSRFFLIAETLKPTVNDEVFNVSTVEQNLSVCNIKAYSKLVTTSENYFKFPTMQ